jgi:putative SOS response-associated peptidase YedK
MQPIHNRMPVILSPDDYARWLSRDIPGEAVADLLRPCNEQDMEAYPVSTRVNNVRNDAPDLIDRAHPP